MHAKDPTRIPAVISALQEAWEGQPDLTLPAFLGMLHNRGLTWATSEDEMLVMLSEVQQEHPSLIDEPPASPVVFTTTSPDLSVTVTGGMVVVRSAETPERMPSLWRCSALRPAGPGRPLVITDTEGVEHRLGVVERATVFDEDRAPGLTGLNHSGVGSARWLISFDDGSRAILAQRLRIWVPQRRDVTVRAISWERVIACAPSAEMKVAPAGGGEPVSLGLVEQVLLLEV